MANKPSIISARLYDEDAEYLTQFCEESGLTKRQALASFVDLHRSINSSESGRPLSRFNVLSEAHKIRILLQTLSRLTLALNRNSIRNAHLKISSQAALLNKTIDPNS